MHCPCRLGLCSDCGGNTSFQYVQCLFELGIGDDQRHQDANYIAERSRRKCYDTMLVTVTCYLVRFVCCGLACAGFHELDRAHTAQTANVADNWPSLLPLTRP